MSFISNANPVGTIVGGSLFPAFVSVILAKAQIFDLVKTNSTSQLISGIFKTTQKFLKCFNGTTISVSFLPTLFAS